MLSKGDISHLVQRQNIKVSILIIADAIERDEMNSIISEDDFNWLCQKGNYGPLPAYSDNEEKECQKEDTLAENPFHPEKNYRIEKEENWEANVAMIRGIVEAIVADCISVGNLDNSKADQRQKNDLDFRSIAVFEPSKLLCIRRLEK